MRQTPPTTCPGGMKTDFGDLNNSSSFGPPVSHFNNGFGFPQRKQETPPTQPGGFGLGAAAEDKDDKDGVSDSNNKSEIRDICKQPTTTESQLPGEAVSDLSDPGDQFKEKNASLERLKELEERISAGDTDVKSAAAPQVKSEQYLHHDTDNGNGGNGDASGVGPLQSMINNQQQEYLQQQQQQMQGKLIIATQIRSMETPTFFD